MNPTSTPSPAVPDPSRFAGHRLLLEAGFTWNGELEAPVYSRRMSGVMTRVQRHRAGWLVEAFKYMDDLHRDATVAGLSLYFPGLTPAARAIELAAAS